MPSINGISILPGQIYTPSNLGDVRVKYRDLTFFVTDKNQQEFEIQAGDVSKELRGLSPKLLSQCLKTNYLALSKIGDDYSISLQHRLNGGGWLSGVIAKCVTRFVGSAITAVGGGVMVLSTVAISGVIGPAGVVVGGVPTALTVGVGLAATDAASKSIGSYFESISFLP